MDSEDKPDKASIVKEAPVTHDLRREGIEDKLKKLPASPGAYIMKDRGGEILYIGKAKNIRSRVRSYFRDTGDTRYAVRFLSGRVEDIDYIVTTNEKEALFLEDTLLKRHKPRYNIQLKDSKTYVSVKVTLNEKFPRILTTRQIKKDGSRYFGPYVSARDVRDTVKFIRRIFPLCTCSASVFRNRVRPCLDYQLGLCPAPAVGLITEEAYRENVEGAVMFLEGRNRELVKTLKKRMSAASGRLDFEEAAVLRDRLSSIEDMLEEQKVVTHRYVDQDVFAIARADGSLAIEVLFIRDGRLVHGDSFFFHDAGLPDEEIMSSFMAQYYRGGRYIPDEVILPLAIEDASMIAGWLTEKKGKKAALTVPVRGDKLKLLRMSETNAVEALKKRAEALSEKTDILDELKKRLHLRNTPIRIEAFDISNIGGEKAVGAMVVFKGGVPDKDSYRLYRIKGVEGPDDYAMMREVLSRRYRKAAEAAEDKGPLPDLILVDGGKGQLNIAAEVIKELGINGVDLAALAKERHEGERYPARGMARVKGERVYRPNVKDPVFLKEGGRPDLLLRRIRDEVHRFAITYHRKIRGKLRGKLSGSEKGVLLDGVTGIGAKRKKALLLRFGGLTGIRNAEPEELMKVPGITEKLALEIKKLKG